MMTTMLLVAVIALGAAQLMLLVRLSNQLTATERVNEKLFERISERINERLSEQVGDRLTHFADALSLLTDTTEQGFAGLTATVAESARKGPAKNTTKGTTKRIVAAVKDGRSVAAVAAAECLSESEVRLHLELGGLPGGEPAAEHGTLRS